MYACSRKRREPTGAGFLVSWHKTDTMSFLWCYLPAAPLYVTCGIMTNHLSLTSYLKIKIPYYAAKKMHCLKHRVYIIERHQKRRRVGSNSSSVVLFTKVQWTPLHLLLLVDNEEWFLLLLLLLLHFALLK